MSQATRIFQTATNITEAYNAVNPEQPLLPDDPRYVDCAPWRGDEHIVNMIAQRIIRADAATPVQFLKQLLAGHRGCGKSVLCKNDGRSARLHHQRLHLQKATAR